MFVLCPHYHKKATRINSFQQDYCTVFHTWASQVSISCNTLYDTSTFFI